MGLGLGSAVEWATVGVSRSGARQSLGLGSWVHGLMNWWVMPIPGKGDISVSACALSAPQGLPIDMAEANRVDVGGTFQTSSRD